MTWQLIARARDTWMKESEVTAEVTVSFIAWAWKWHLHRLCRILLIPRTNLGIVWKGTAITEYHRLGGLYTTEFYFLQFQRLGSPSSSWDDQTLMGLKVGWGGASRNHEGEAHSVSQAGGVSDAVPARWFCWEWAKKKKNGLCQHFCLGESCLPALALMPDTLVSPCMPRCL